MSKGIFLGVDDMARTVKKLFAGVDDVARTVKKAWVGVGGVARPCFSGEKKVVYFGHIKKTRTGLYEAGFSVDGKAFYTIQNLGGRSFRFIVYDDDLLENETVIPFPDTGVYDFYTRGASGYSTCNHIEYADFCMEGVAESGNFVHEVTVLCRLDENQLVTMVDVSDMTAFLQAGAPVATYSIFNFGNAEGATLPYVFAADENMLTARLADLDHYALGNIAASSRSHVIFGGGGHGNYATAYNADLVKISMPDDVRIGDFATTTKGGKYALFSGGHKDSWELSGTYLFDEDLILRVVEDPASRWDASAGLLGLYTVIAGGATESGELLSEVDVFDEDFLKQTELTLGEPGVLTFSANTLTKLLFDATEERIETFMLL